MNDNSTYAYPKYFWKEGRDWYFKLRGIKYGPFFTLEYAQETRDGLRNS